MDLCSAGDYRRVRQGLAALLAETSLLNVVAALRDICAEQADGGGYEPVATRMWLDVACRLTGVVEEAAWTENQTLAVARVFAERSGD